MMVVDPGTFLFLSLRLDAAHLPEAMAHIRARWAVLFPGEQIDTFILRGLVDAQYRADQVFSRIVQGLTGLAVFIACAGLLGLAAFTTERRTKEIGIRKVLGASAVGLVGLLTGDIIRLVGLAFVIAAT